MLRQDGVKLKQVRARTIHSQNTKYVNHKRFRHTQFTKIVALRSLANVLGVMGVGRVRPDVGLPVIVSGLLWMESQDASNIVYLDIKYLHTLQVITVKIKGESESGSTATHVLALGKLNYD